MMANAYYKLISDFVRKNTKVNEPEKQSVKN
jgi:hypothetical protein